MRTVILSITLLMGILATPSTLAAHQQCFLYASFVSALSVWECGGESIHLVRLIFMIKISQDSQLWRCAPIRVGQWRVIAAWSFCPSF